jgi:cyclopropane fatty-acyl-phospholipid synthase-like methyltransferase
MTEKNWWQEFFDEDFSSVLLDRESDPSLRPTADFLYSALHLKPGSTVFDQCCGTGAVSMALAEKNVVSIGIDQADHYIRQARRNASERGLYSAIFQTADGFEYTTPYKCDAAFNWFSSFGYTDDDSLNIEMFRRVSESLRAGAYFAVEYMNVPNIRANFQPVFTRKAIVDDQEITIEKHTTLDDARGMIGSRWVYRFPDGQVKEASGESRLYEPEDIADLLECAGFEDIVLQGGFKGEACDNTQQRVIAIARMPS